MRQCVDRWHRTPIDTRTRTVQLIPPDLARRVLTAEEYADMIGVSRASAYRAVKRGEIPSFKIGKRILIPGAALAHLLETGHFPAA